MQPAGLTYFRISVSVAAKCFHISKVKEQQEHKEIFIIF